MKSSLVRRDQFNISPQGIVHKPTDAAFTPSPGDPLSGFTRLGTLGNKHPNGNDYNSDDVQRMTRELGPSTSPQRDVQKVANRILTVPRSRYPSPPCWRDHRTGNGPSHISPHGIARFDVAVEFRIQQSALIQIKNGGSFFKDFSTYRRPNGTNPLGVEGSAIT
jgi:hypothetical protein